MNDLDFIASIMIFVVGFVLGSAIMYYCPYITEKLDNIHDKIHGGY